MQKLPLVEIFSTLEGEGTAAGFPTTFVRLFGCNLRCGYCDTPYSYAPARPAFALDVAEVCERVRQLGNGRVCLTGGEPLLNMAAAIALLKGLLKVDGILDIHIETNGAINIEECRAGLLNTVGNEKVRFIMDWKTSGSGEAGKMLAGNLQALAAKDELKFVIGSVAEFYEAADIVRDSGINVPVILFSPMFGVMEPRQLAELLIKEKIPGGKLSLQLHKILWEPERRGV